MRHALFFKCYLSSDKEFVRLSTRFPYAINIFSDFVQFPVDSKKQEMATLGGSEFETESRQSDAGKIDHMVSSVQFFLLLLY